MLNLPSHHSITPGGGLIVSPDAFTVVHQHLFIRLAQQHRLPAVYFLRTSVAEGAANLVVRHD
jgi:hypothetical protein